MFYYKCGIQLASKYAEDVLADTGSAFQAHAITVNALSHSVVRCVDLQCHKQTDRRAHATAQR